MRIVFIGTSGDERSYFAESFPEHEVEFVPGVEDVPADAGIVCVSAEGRIDKDFLSSRPSLRCVATRSSVTDHLDKTAAVQRDIMLASVPDYGAATVAEHTFALIFGVARRLRDHFEARRGHRRSDVPHGMELRGKTLGIVGTGRVGWQVAAAAKGFGMRVAAYDVSPDQDLAREMGFAYLALDELMHCSDIVTLHLPLVVDTYHLLDHRRLSLGKPGQILINTSRGALVEPRALMQALESGQLGGLGLDVLEDESALHGDPTGAITSQIIARLHAPSSSAEASQTREQRLRQLQGMLHNQRLLAHPNVFYTPNIGYDSVEALEAINRYTVRNIRGFLSGQVPPEAIVV